MSSNDYLGLASNENLRQSFLQQYGDNFPSFTSSSSRLLTGNFPVYTDLEQLIAQRFQRESVLLFNSGYHANLGILPALTTTKSLILADKLVHASMIDGIRLSQCEFFRYRHNDYEHLKSLLEKNAGKFDRTFIVTESVFSMDGDVADLNYLVELKKQHACGSKEFTIIRTGADVKFKCNSCGRIIMLDRETAEKRIKKFL